MFLEKFQITGKHTQCTVRSLEHNSLSEISNQLNRVKSVRILCYSSDVQLRHKTNIYSSLLIRFVVCVVKFILFILEPILAFFSNLLFKISKIV